MAFARVGVRHPPSCSRSSSTAPVTASRSTSARASSRSSTTPWKERHVVTTSDPGRAPQVRYYTERDEAIARAHHPRSRPCRPRQRLQRGRRRRLLRHRRRPAQPDRPRPARPAVERRVGPRPGPRPLGLLAQGRHLRPRHPERRADLRNKNRPRLLSGVVMSPRPAPSTTTTPTRPGRRRPRPASARRISSPSSRRRCARRRRESSARRPAAPSQHPSARGRDDLAGAAPSSRPCTAHDPRDPLAPARPRQLRASRPLARPAGARPRPTPRPRGSEAPRSSPPPTPRCAPSPRSPASRCPTRGPPTSRGSA